MANDENPAEYIDLAGDDLSWTDLTEASLNGVNLTGANLTEANLTEAKVTGVNLSGADLTEAKLINADLTEAKLTGVNLSGADLTEAKLINADLSGADLTKAKLSGANLSGADLTEAKLSGAYLIQANLGGTNLTGADLSGADLAEADLTYADLSGAKLTEAYLIQADLTGTDLSGADLTGANLARSILIDTNVTAARLEACSIYGISAWDLRGVPAQQRSLVITPPGQPAITVDDLEVAQFIYLLLSNPKVRNFIDTITAKVVLILGRFSDERKAVLDAIRDELRQRNYIPILFDFQSPASKDVTGTVETLARMARFIIADLTDPSSIPHELATIVPHLRTTPVLPIRLAGSSGYGMFSDYQRVHPHGRAYPWVLDTHEYVDGVSLIAELPEVIAPADKMADELRVIA